MTDLISQLETYVDGIVDQANLWGFYQMLQVQDVKASEEEIEAEQEAMSLTFQKVENLLIWAAPILEDYEKNKQLLKQAVERMIYQEKLLEDFKQHSADVLSRIIYNGR